MLFQNKDELLSHPCSNLRKTALMIADAGIKKVIPYSAVNDLIKLTEKEIKIGNLIFIRKKVNNIYVVGAGKGSFPIAQALDEVFDGLIKKGIVIVKEGEKRRLKNIDVYESSHPIPDERSITSANKIMEILNCAKEGDLVFAAITGGSSALVNMPAQGISIDDLRDLNIQLLKSGAEIGKINAVRKHICMIKGGRVVTLAQPAHVITFSIDTTPSDMPWPDMCLPDPTTFEDAVNVLKTYSLWDSTPSTIKKYLLHGLEHPVLETPKNLDHMKHSIFNVANPSLLCTAAAKKAKELGYTPYILSTVMEGEAKEVGIVMAGIVNEILSFQRPFATPCAIISGGETTVTINGKCGKGGPNQETVLGFISKVRHNDGYVCLCVDTDGTDGPCDAAGGIVDGYSKKAIAEKNIILNEVLFNHDSLNTLTEVGDIVYTGHTGTNVMNLRILLINPEE